MNFRECPYTEVISPDTGEYFTSDMIEITITDEMAQKVKNGNKLTLFDGLFMPD